MKIYVIVFFLLIFLLSCNSLETNKMSVIIDTTNLKKMPIHERIEKEQTLFYYHVKYAGKEQDTIFIPNHLCCLEAFLEDSSKQISTRNSLMDSGAIKILIDTTQNIYDYGIAKGVDIKEINAENVKSKMVAYKSYPLIIKNVSSKTISVLETPDLIIEAQDKKGVWKSIQNNDFKRFCATVANTINIPAGYLVIIPIPIYKGDFTTKLRVRLGKNISNEYTGQINLEQFEKTQY
ncbi:hypothetical protein AD998_15035 [bacterium 336/3]|nr:hypothetical protein AD998_15035 [bacterium 336/3]